MSDYYTKVGFRAGKGWYVSVGRLEYLHSDGVRRFGTFNRETGEWAGYFKAKKDASAALAKWRGTEPKGE